jgi:hypothetical protein
MVCLIGSINTYLQRQEVGQACDPELAPPRSYVITHLAAVKLGQTLENGHLHEKTYTNTLSNQCPLVTADPPLFSRLPLAVGTSYFSRTQ